MTQANRPPIWFWMIGVAALLWNGIGVLAYLQQVMMSAEEFAALPSAQQELLSTQPVWVTAAFAIAVFAGFVASISWLLRKRITVRLFLLSLLAVIVQFGSYFIIDGYSEYMSGQGWLFPILILLLAVAFLLLSRRAEQTGLLR